MQSLLRDDEVKEETAAAVAQARRQSHSMISQMRWQRERERFVRLHRNGSARESERRQRDMEGDVKRKKVNVAG